MFLYHLMKMFSSVKVCGSFCLCCGGSSDGVALCDGCQKDLPWFGHACQQCAMPLIERYRLLCSVCTHKLKINSLIRILFWYDTPIRGFIGALKFNGKIYYAKFFGQLMGQNFNQKPLPQALLPVPLHRNRLQKRGFNQALEIAREVSKYMKIPLLHDVCCRTIDTPPQMTLTASIRKKNLRHAFALTREITYQHIAIIDDVMTTGSTVRVLRDLLFQKGVQRVDIWCVCRA